MFDFKKSLAGSLVDLRVTRNLLFTRLRKTFNENKNPDDQIVAYLIGCTHMIDLILNPPTKDVLELVDFLSCGIAYTAALKEFAQEELNLCKKEKS